MTKQLVKQWMTPDPVCVMPDTTLPQAHKLMDTKNIRRLPVIDKRGRLVGIVTLGDIRGAEASTGTLLNVWELNYFLNDLKVKAFMSKNPITVTPEMTIKGAASVMLKNRVSGLPVMRGEALVGIITESDIFRVVIEEAQETTEPERRLPIGI